MDNIYQRISDEDVFGEDETERSEIQEFFHGQTILLTGCTGFLGKCFVEKILRDCAGIKKLILIVRSHKVSAKERMKKYFQHEIFEKLRSYRPNFESKVCIVEGNLTEENLGVSIEDRKMLIDEVTMIYHNASNVKFATKVSDSLKCNVLGTKYMIELARECKKLVCFIYISTAYSHSYNKVIEEKCYPPPADLKMVQDIIDADEIAKNGIPPATVNETCKPWANIYTFGKSIAESLVEEFGKETSYPCIIYRPSQIISTYQEPFPGWCGNYNGPALAFVGYGLGIVHINTPIDYVQDYVPADMCTNSILALTWDTVTNRKQDHGKVFVFNYASSTVNPLSLKEFEDNAVPKGRDSPSIRMVGPNFLLRAPCWFLFYVFHFLLHGIPAVIADIVLMAMLRKPRAVAIFYKITMNFKAILYWGISDWRITVKETQKMWERMNNRDRFLFYNDLRTVDWSIFGYTYWFGIKKYLLKEPLDDPPARRKYMIIQLAFHSFKILVIVYILYYLLSYWLSLISPITELVKLKYICTSP